ncbi:Cap15 family cyclic dinucleotide receptor domain-containing protein [Lentisalinibacter orientalis]|uniref:Cap15 family cyclic dinucleotide receptor domain-containing protein n=1 Tax=Lentisalinibacter orientalis TaxID=2992241 RepID=UPI00386B1A65
MLTRTELWLIVILGAGLTLLGLLIQGKSLSIAGVATTLGTTVALLYGGIWLFDSYLWRWSIFRGWLVNRPYLQGSWAATLHSDWIDPETNERVPPIEAYMVVRQTLTSLSMRLFTEKSRSALVAHAIETEPDGLFQLSAVYRNYPKIEYQGKQSSIHHGALLIDVHEVRQERLEGHYWTDRETRGTVVLERRVAKLFSSFDEARSALQGG